MRSPKDVDEITAALELQQLITGFEMWATNIYKFEGSWEDKFLIVCSLILLPTTVIEEKHMFVIESTTKMLYDEIWIENSGCWIETSQ